MTKLISQKPDWCHIQIGSDMMWWTQKLSNESDWDMDRYGILDPKQVSHITDSCHSLRDYSFDPDLIDSAFFAFRIEEELPNQIVRLVRVKESLLDSDELLFALPDMRDDEKGPYADFLEKIIHSRVQLLKDLISSKGSISVEELEDNIRESSDLMDGETIHCFNQLTAILEYVPEGIELEDEDEKDIKNDKEDLKDFPDIDVEENIIQDPSLRWDEDEEEAIETV